MVPVVPAAEPANFDARVRKPGLKWIGRNLLDPEKPLPSGIKVPDYWRNCSSELWTSYNGVCAYSCILVRRGTGNPAVEHFAPKSRKLSVAYEWSNYRLACLTINSKKHSYEDVLDPFLIQPGLYFLEIAAGRIYVNPDVADPLREAAEQTIRRLGLDQQRFRDDRAFDYDCWDNGEWADAYMQRRSPFVWSEIQRQGVVRRTPFQGVPLRFT